MKTRVRWRSAGVVTCVAMQLAVVMLGASVASVRAQGVGPNVVVPNTRPRTNVQITNTMQMPWTVSIAPATNFVAIGQCLPVYIELLDASGKDIPRNPTGVRVSIQDFDWSATGNGALGKYSGPNAWSVCACPAAAVGSTIHVMATYPAKSMPEKAKVPGVAFQSYIELPVTKALGTNVPAGCENVLRTTTVAISTPARVAPLTVDGPAHDQVTQPSGSGAAGAAAGAPGAAAGAPGGAAGGGAAAAPGVADAAPNPGAAEAAGSKGAEGAAAAGGAAQTSGAGETAPAAAAAGGAPGPGGAAGGGAAGAAGAAEAPAAGGGAGAAAGGGAAHATTAPATTPSPTGAPVVGGPIAAISGAGRQPTQTMQAPLAQLQPVNPTGFVATQTGNGAVTLSWRPVPGVSFYQLWGPGLPNTGVSILSGTSQAVTGVRAGLQSWTVGSFYMPGPVSTAASAFSKTQLLVTAPVTASPTPP